MQVYIIEPTHLKYFGKCIVAANDFNEAGRIFNQEMEYNFGTDNAIKTMNCNTVLTDKLSTNVNTPEVLLNCIYEI